MPLKIQSDASYITSNKIIGKVLKGYGIRLLSTPYLPPQNAGFMLTKGITGFI
jgi:hypothetical protein